MDSDILDYNLAESEIFCSDHSESFPAVRGFGGGTGKRYEGLKKYQHVALGGVAATFASSYRKNGANRVHSSPKHDQNVGLARHHNPTRSGLLADIWQQKCVLHFEEDISRSTPICGLPVFA